MTNGHKQAHENAASDVLAALYFDKQRIAEAQYQFMLRPTYFPTPALQLLYQTLCDLYRDNEVINDSTILKRIGSQVEHKWLLDILNVYTPQIGVEFHANCKLVSFYGTRAGAQRVLASGMSELQKIDGKPTQEIISETVDNLSGLHTTTGVKNVTATELADEFEQFMATPAPKTRSTGLAWLDDLSNGFSAGDIWWIVSAYKMRKTTLMLNLVLHAAMNNTSVTFLSREMSKRQVTAQLVSMLAIGHLLEVDLYEATTQRKATGEATPINWISARSLIQSRENYRKWDKRKVEAVDSGIQQFKKIGKCLRIYDTTDEGGRLRDIASAQMIVKRDKAMYGTEMVCADYLQLFDAPGAGIFDKTSYAARTFQEMAKLDNVTIMIAAQQNEDAIRNGDMDDYSPGVKGGGDPAATADFLLRTRYKKGDLQDDKKLEIAMTLSRHGSGGGDTKNVVRIHPASGLILDTEYALKQMERSKIQFGKGAK